MNIEFASFFTIYLLIQTEATPTVKHTPPSSYWLQWYNISNAVDRGALCNDFSTAGYFISLHNSTCSKWVIYLESGGGCTSPQSCNARFIDETIRSSYTTTVNRTRHVDVQRAWDAYKDRPLEVTSKLMTSLWRFSADLREDDGIWMIKGKGMMSRNHSENPDFHDYNHVIIPYCSSDVWLKQTNNFVIAKNSSFQFQFDPNASHHQFTFRGAAIFQSVIKDLFAYHSLNNATNVLLAGSSAGGIGAMNHANWLRQQLLAKAEPTATLQIFMDSSWFIDYQGSITEQFAPEDIQALLASGEVLDTCRNSANDPSVCLSSVHFLTHFKDQMKDIPTFVLFSRYDLYLLLSSLQHIETENILEIMRIGSEYSGSMNASLLAVATEMPNFSYFVTSCFQHVYLATSSLWGENSVLGTAGIDGQLQNNRFEHKISSDVWTRFHLEHLNSSLMVEQVSIPRALHEWTLASKNGEVVRYHDYCSGPHCNSQCPDTIALGENVPYWETEVQGILLALVVFASLSSVLVKVLLCVRSKYHSTKQSQFVEWSSHELGDETESTFPYCKNSDAISVACLNLRYSVIMKKSDFKNASSPYQRKRLLSLAAADSDPVRACRSEGGEGVTQLDLETGQTIVGESDFAKSIREFQEMHTQRSKARRRFKEHQQAKQLKQSKKGSKKKEILKGITTYFNPGELVAIMGPSGSGKTTFLDLLAGRRNGRDNYQGELIVNGIPMDEVRDWYIANTGYVLQLATPYYEELTVRENITLAAQMRLPKSLSHKERFERVEQVMAETGLYSLASTVVGGATGPGLSGGQKRRLCVALQLINIPSLIFLDEPTSGLDAASSLELLSHLHRVASSNRAVILTIHQPRLEIFHMFDKVILLCQGQIAYHGIPDKAYEVFLEANQAEGKRMDSLQSKNPADAIMDMLGSEEARAAILSYYQASDEPDAVETAIEEVCSVGRESVSSRQTWAQRPQQKSGVLNRVSCLESRAVKRAGNGQVLYLPLIFAVYGILLGTVYIQTRNGTLLLSGYGVFSCASGLFMFPIIYTYLYRALEIFSLEYSDGVGSPIELVLQTFLRFSSLAFLPNLFCSTAIYLLAIPYTQYDLWVFLQVTVVALALNHTWIALLTFVITTRPGFAHRISPVLSAIAGFAGGFFVPPRLMPPWYSWLFYINPNYYGFSAMARLVLQDINLGCPYESPIECYPSTGAYILTYFDLHAINPYLNIMVLMTLTAVCLSLACLSLSYRHSHLLPRLRRILSKKKPKEGSKLTTKVEEEFPPSIPDSFYNDELKDTTLSTPLDSTNLEDFSEEFKKVTVKPLPKLLLPTSDLDTGNTEEVSGRRLRLKNRKTLSRMLQNGETHQVWTPGADTGGKRSSPSSKVSIEERRKSLFHRINTYRGGGPITSILPDNGGEKGTMNVPCSENMARRMAQWKKIEEEASQLEQVQRGEPDADVVPTPSSGHRLASTQLQTLPSPPSTHCRPAHPTQYEAEIHSQSMPSLLRSSYTSLPSSPLNPPYYIYHCGDQPPKSPVSDLCAKTETNARSLGISNINAQAIISCNSNNNCSSSSQQSSTEKMPSKAYAAHSSSNMQQSQAQYFIFPEVPSSIVELMPKDALSMDAPDTVNNMNSSHSLPGFQLHRPLAISPLKMSSGPHSPTQLTTLTTQLQSQQATHKAHSHTLPHLQLNTDQAAVISNSRALDSPMAMSPVPQERKLSGVVAVMDSIIEEANSEASRSNSSLLDGKQGDISSCVDGQDSLNMDISQHTHLNVDTVTLETYKCARSRSDELLFSSEDSAMKSMRQQPVYSDMNSSDAEDHLCIVDPDHVAQTVPCEIRITLAESSIDLAPQCMDSSDTQIPKESSSISQEEDAQATGTNKQESKATKSVHLSISRVASYDMSDKKHMPVVDPAATNIFLEEMCESLKLGNTEEHVPKRAPNLSHQQLKEGLRLTNKQTKPLHSETKANEREHKTPIKASFLPPKDSTPSKPLALFLRSPTDSSQLDDTKDHSMSTCEARSRKPIPVSSPTNPTNSEGNSLPDLPSAIYVVKPPTSLAKITKQVISHGPESNYQLTDF